MVMTLSQMLPLGTKAPEFSLPDPSGKLVSLADFPKASAYLVVFMCNHCPFVKHLRDELAQLSQELQTKNVAMFGINSNDFEKYPDDSPEKMAEEIKHAGYAFPYLIDKTQDVAKAYQAACTPDFFLFDSDESLVYRGQFDDSRPGNEKPVTGADLRAAIEAVVTGKPLSEKQTASVGCNIKWKPGNEPSYFG